MILGIVLLAGIVISGADEQADLEKWILKTQSENKSKLVRGRFRATAEETTGIMERKGAITLTWDGHNAHWDYMLNEKIGGQRRIKAIERDREMWFFDQTNGFFEHVTENKKTLPLVRRLRPEQCWFGHFGSTRQWSELFDRSTFPEETFSTTIATQDLKIVVRRVHLPSNVSADLIWSPASGGNLISYSSQQPNQHETHEMDWQQHPKGLWYVKELRNERKRPNGELLFRFKLSVHEFDPEPIIPDGQFDPNKLQKRENINPPCPVE